MNHLHELRFLGPQISGGACGDPGVMVLDEYVDMWYIFKAQMGGGAAGEGGPYGMALLAAYRANRTEGETLEDYLNGRVSAGVSGTTLTPEAEDAAGFNAYLNTVPRSAVRGADGGGNVIGGEPLCWKR